MIAFGCALGAATGLAWAFAYPLDAASRMTVAALHALAGASLGAVMSVPTRGVSPRSARLALLAAVAGCLCLVPAGLAAFEAGTRGMAERVTLTIAGVGVTLLVASGAARYRASALAAGAAGLVAPWLVAAYPASAPHGAASKLTAWPVIPVEPSRPAVRKVAVIGLDGADWRVIDPMIAQGELPNLAGLAARGTTAVLRSVEPTYSPVVWSSVFSGKVPEAHGITGWYGAHAANRRAAFLWDLVAGDGAPSVVVNVPGTWPPAAVRGGMISGFPMPGVMTTANEDGQPIGTVVAPADRARRVPTAPTREDGADWRAAELNLGDALPEPRSRVQHYGIDGALRRGVLATRRKTIRVRVGPQRGDGARRYEIAGRTFALRTGEWTPWLTDDAFGIPIVYRARRLAGEDLYVTSPFQDARNPLHPFASGSVAEAAARAEPYVVEGIGWRSAEDPDVRAALLEELAELEGQHRRAALRLLADVPDWRLFAHVVTITDRASHAFWPFHDPSAYADLPPEEVAAAGAYVRDAYRIADAELGRLLEAIGPDALVLVASDHGFQADPDHREGTHRIEGIFVAAGPTVAQRSDRLALSVLDVTPTALAALGLPIAHDMDGAPQLEIFASPPPVAEIATYEAGGGPLTPRIVIDSSTEEQLRSLGYLE